MANLKDKKLALARLLGGNESLVDRVMKAAEGIEEVGNQLGLKSKAKKPKPEKDNPEAGSPANSSGANTDGQEINHQHTHAHDGYGMHTHAENMVMAHDNIPVAAHDHKGHSHDGLAAHDHLGNGFVSAMAAAQKKEINLDSQSDKVRQAVAALNAPSGAPEMLDSVAAPTLFVWRVYGDTVIIASGDDYWSAPYSVNASGDVELAPESEWEQVEEAWTPIAGDDEGPGEPEPALLGKEKSAASSPMPVRVSEMDIPQLTQLIVESVAAATKESHAAADQVAAQVKTLTDRLSRAEEQVQQLNGARPKGFRASTASETVQSAKSKELSEGPQPDPQTPQVANDFAAFITGHVGTPAGVIPLPPT